MEDKLVSVAISFYSGKETLVESLDSVFAQTYQNIEVILVNDGSKEDISDIVEEYSKRSKFRYYLKENGGCATARNRGIVEAKGEYIAIMDSDDVWLPTKLSKQIKFMEDNNISWSHTGFWYWDSDKNVITPVDNHYNYGNVHDQCKIHFVISSPSVVIHRRVIEEHDNMMIPENTRCGQDVQWYRKLSKYYKLGFIEEPLMKVRVRNGLSGRKAFVRLEVSNALNEKRKQKLDGYEVKDPFLRWAMRYNAFWYRTISSLNLNNMSFRETLSRVVWFPEFIFERLYSKKFHKKSKEDEKYILRNCHDIN